MDAFGVRFEVKDLKKYKAMKILVEEIKKDKDADDFRDPELWKDIVPDDVKSRFYWPTFEERKQWLNMRNSTVIAVSEPSEQLGQQWDFYRIFESIEESEYSIIGCEQIKKDIAELQIDPWGYPYGGVGPLMALAEAFGFHILGVNECGKYEPRSQLFI